MIDVLILYTQQMKDKYGTKLGALLQHLVDLGNTAYRNSNVNTTLKIAAKRLLAAEGAGEDKSTSEALASILADQQVAAMRDAAAADLVSLVRIHPGDGSSCGQGYMMVPGYEPFFAPYAFSVTQVRSAAEAKPYYCDERTLIHEIGHNQGCNHDRDHASGSGVYPYSYGYDVAGVFGTVMSYDKPMITYFSNPNVKYANLPIGRGVDEPDSAYNALSINKIRTIVANFRVRKLADFAASPTEGVVPLTVQFQDRSVKGVTSWKWSFGDGCSSSLRNPKHKFNAPGVYPVTLAVRGTGISASETKPAFITVKSGPSAANFTGTPTSGTSPLKVMFKERSKGEITSRLWKFGDGLSSEATNPAHTYKSPGNYTVKLFVDGPGGSDRMVKTSYIKVTQEQ